MTPITVPAVHLIGLRKGRTLCDLLTRNVDQWCPVGMWPAVKPDYKCPLCDRAYATLVCQEA